VEGGESAIEFEKGGDFVGTSSMTPGCGFPQGVAGDCGEVVIGPPSLCLGNGLLQGFDGILA